MVFLFGGNHHEDTVRPDTLFFQLDRPVYSAFTYGYRGNNNIVRINAFSGAAFSKTITAQMGQYLLSIAELRHQVCIAQVGNFDVAAARKNEFLGIKYLGPRGNEFFQVLKTVPDGDVAYGHFLGHPRKYFPIVMFSHLISSL